MNCRTHEHRHFERTLRSTDTIPGPRLAEGRFRTIDQTARFRASEILSVRRLALECDGVARNYRINEDNANDNGAALLSVVRRVPELLKRERARWADRRCIDLDSHGEGAL